MTKWLLTVFPYLVDTWTMNIINYEYSQHIKGKGKDIHDVVIVFMRRCCVIVLYYING